MYYMIYILSILLLIQIVVLVVFVYQSIRQRYFCNMQKDILKISLDDFDVIIAAREDCKIIRCCITNVLSVGFKNIILCIDGCDDSIYLKIKSEFPSIVLLNNEKQLGKIKSQKRCLDLSNKENVLILDADITLNKDELYGFVSYYINSKADFLCPYSIGLYSGGNSLLYSIAETDRYMRQRVVRAGRDAYGVSNLSGYCMLCKRIKYINIIDADAIQDDVIATINLLQRKYKVKTYHKAVCSEIERNSFGSYLMQKTRWTAGNIVLIKSYAKLFESTSLVKAFAFTSSFLLWYWSLWVDFIAFLFSIIYPPIFIFLVIEGIIKFIGLAFAGRSKNKIFSILLYLVIWPIFSTMCLILSPYYLMGKIVEQKTRR